MKKLLALAFVFSLTMAPVKDSHALVYTSSTIAGVVVAQYAGTLAGVAVSAVLAGGALLSAAGKEAAVKSAQNDIANFKATGELSLGLENSIMAIQSLDESISEEEAMDMILEAMDA